MRVSIIEMEQYLMSFAKDFEVEDVQYDSQNEYVWFNG